MIEINLAPEEYRVREKRSSPAFSIAISLAVVLLLGLSIESAVALMSNNGKIHVAKSNMAAIQSTVNTVNTIQNNITSTLQPEVNAIEGILSNEINWAQVLNIISSNLLNNVWLSKLDIVDEADNWTITVFGFALPVPDAAAIATVGDYTTSLRSDIEALLADKEQDPDIEMLTTTKQKMADRVEIVEFKTSLSKDK